MSDRIARAERAQVLYEEFVEPMIDQLRNAYSERIVEIATTDLNPRSRADKLTALSNAIKVVNTLDDGMKAMITDGELAKIEKLRAEKVERMSPSQRRLLGIAPY